MRYVASVTFESDTQAPRSTRLEFDAKSPGKAASIAIRGARQAHKGARWSSLVVVLQKMGEGE